MNNDADAVTTHPDWVDDFLGDIQCPHCGIEQPGAARAAEPKEPTA